MRLPSKTMDHPSYAMQLKSRHSRAPYLGGCGAKLSLQQWPLLKYKHLLWLDQMVIIPFFSHTFNCLFLRLSSRREGENYLRTLGCGSRLSLSHGYRDGCPYITIEGQEMFRKVPNC